MGKCKLFFYRVLHFVFRHITQLDNKIELRIQAAMQQQTCCEEELPCAFDCKDPFFAPIRLITHAGGGLQGQSYLNCAEAPEAYYAQGNRVFEFDVTVSQDRQFILSHEDVQTTEAVFLSKKIDRRFSPLAFGDALTFLKNYEDTTVIFDCKSVDMGAFAKYLCEKTEASDRRRIVIQVFNEQDILDVRAVWDFKMLYVCMLSTDYQQVALHCLKHNVGAVSISYKALQERTGWDVFARKNICTFAYTVNTLAQYDWVRQQGITGVFSDFLLQEDATQEGGSL